MSIEFLETLTIAEQGHLINIEYDSLIKKAEKQKKLIELLPEIKKLDKKITQYYVLVSKEQDGGSE